MTTTNSHSIFDRLLFRIRHRNLLAQFRKAWLQFCGVKIGKNTVIPKISITWPHQVQIGNNCILEPDIFFKFDGIWCQGPSIIIGDSVFIGRGCEFNISKHITIGSRSGIASGCKFVDHHHAIVGTKIDEVPGQAVGIEIGEDVWLGYNVVILKGVKIGASAVVAAGAVVTKDVPVGEIWGGVPARRLSSRQERSSRVN